MSRALHLGSLLLTVLLVTAGCGGEDEGSSKVEATKDSSGTATIDITVKDGTITPQGAKVEVEAGKPLKLHVTADDEGEIHVHSSPEQEFEYAEGTTDKTLTLDQPGVVEVESHTLDKLILQLEVR